jgi:hypothetical protein
MKVEITKRAKPTNIQMDRMNIGQVGRIIDESMGSYNGEIVLAVYGGSRPEVVSLSNPGHTWTAPCPLQVEILEPGAVLTLTV